MEKRYISHSKWKQKRQDLSFQISKILYKGVSGFELSNEYRKGLGSEKDTKSLTYGEIVPQSFVNILHISTELCTSKNNLEFIDLGCGIGRAVISAALSPISFRRCWGIEIVADMVKYADKVLEKLILALENAARDNNSIEANSGKKKGNEKITKGSAKSMLSLEQIVIHIESQLADGTNRIEIEKVANSLCLQYGHKMYRQSMKQLGGKFAKVLETLSDRFEICEDKFLSRINIEIGASPEIVHQGGNDVVLVKELPQSNLEDVFRIDPEASSTLQPLPLIEFVAGDIFKIEWWTTADIVYVASLLFTDEMMVELARRVCNMKTGSCLISLKLLPRGINSFEEMDTKVELKFESFFKMSWQMAKVYIYVISR